MRAIGERASLSENIAAESTFLSQLVLLIFYHFVSSFPFIKSSHSVRARRAGELFLKNPAHIPKQNEMKAVRNSHNTTSREEISAGAPPPSPR